MVPSIYSLLLFSFFISFSPFVLCPPPPDKRQKTEHGGNSQENMVQDDKEDPQKLYNFSYSKYLELVVQILETQPKFQERLKQMSEQDIKEGKIADHLDELDQDVFEQLTKAKITEIERLRAAIEETIKKDGDARNVQMPEHLDVNDWQKFGKEDLRKLIQKTVVDMNKADEERRAKFKEYEMQKKAEEDHKLAKMAEDEREKAKKEIEESKKRHNQHEAMKHPGGKEQLEEVWEERDHMDKDSFDPKTFFNLHDLNGDGFLNEDELEALFQVQLEKVYNETSPDDDPKERIEEMHRMREHVMKQIDKNGDRMISLQEFMQDAEVQEMEGAKDEGWQDIGAQKIYTEEELAKFEKEYAQQKGWGEHAYDPIQPVQPVPVQQNSHPNGAYTPQSEFGHPPQAAQPIPVQQQPPIPQQIPSEKVPRQVDPVYGV